MSTPAFPASQHTLANGFTLYLSPNPAEPRIYTEIAVRAGSKHDPDRSTGLAHYLEHMLFKGTAQLGTSNWEAEEPLLLKIAETYEDHRNTTDPAERRRLYQRIDQLSQQAAAYALPGEYDRIMAQMGARGTNAYTWVDQTIFLNDIPSGELARWMQLESERFSRLVLRLFHTELETVFEEFNISQDKDVRKVMRTANEALFSPHPYGTHTTIGKGEHLKAPSHFDIYEFFSTHYVPANMAIVLAGDFDPNEALELARNTFGTWESKPLPEYTPVVLPDPPPPRTLPRETSTQPSNLYPKLKPILSSSRPSEQSSQRPSEQPPEQPSERQTFHSSLSHSSLSRSSLSHSSLSVVGQEAPSVFLHYRIPGATTREAIVAQVAVAMLSNRQAGLFDQRLVSAQQVLSASAGITPMAEYANIRASIKPRPGQTLAEAADLALEQVARLAEGDYPAWLREAVIVDHELTMTRSAESNQGRASILTMGFIHRLPLEEVLHRIEALRTVTDEEVQAFAKTYLRAEQCVVVFKEQGEDNSVMKVEKPEITPVPLHTQRVSGFAERLLAITPTQIEARFADLETEITQLAVAPGVDLHHLPNEENGLFELLYVFDFGTRADAWIGLATKYLSFLGTAALTNAEVQVKFYRLGLEWQVQATAHRTFLGVNGLDTYLPEGLAMLEDLIRNCEPDQDRWENFVADVAQKRLNARSDKQIVLRKGMNQFGRYGEHSPLLTRPSLETLKAAPATQLTERLHQLADTRRSVFYYGPRPADEVIEVLREQVNFTEIPNVAARSRELNMLQPKADQVLFVDFPMVQVEVLMLRHVRNAFSKEAWALSEWFNQYYGVGLSSVVFAELRESRALAYSTYAYAESPQRAVDPHVLQAFIGTQPDKLVGALEAMRSLLDEWHWDAEAAERVRNGMLQQMRTERDLRQSRYWLWRQGQDRGITGNQRKWIYEYLSKATPDELRRFMAELAGAPTTYLMLGQRESVKFDELSRFGQVRHLALDEVMG